MDHPDLDALAHLVRSLPEADRERFDHLFSCTGCRERLVWAHAAAETQGETPEAPCWPAETGGAAAVLDRVKLAGERQEARWGEDREQARGLYDELMGLPEGERAAAVEQERFGSPGLAALLLAASTETVDHDAARAETLAALALDVAGGVEGGRLSGSLVRLLHARCLCALGEARRRRGDAQAAGWAFAVAARRLEDEPLELEERALACRLLARLRADQARFDEALGLLRRAVGLYAGLTRFEELGETLGEEGLLILARGEAHAALPLLREAVGHVGAAPHPRAAVSVRLGLARCHAELGQCAQADAALSSARQLYPLCGRRARLDFLRAEARVDALCQRVLRGVTKLMAAMQRLVASEPYEAAAAAIELAEIYLDHGMGESLQRLRGEAAPLVASRRLDARARLVLGVTLTALRSPAAPATDLIERAARYFAVPRHDPRRRLEPPAGGALELAWEELDDESVRRDLVAAAELPEELAGRGASEIDPASRERLSAACEQTAGVRLVFADAAAAAEPG